MNIKKDILIRTYLVYLIIVLFAISIVCKAVYTQRVQGKYWVSMADTAHNRTENIIAERGSIYAEDGSVLSTSIPEFDIYVDFGADGLRDKNGKLFKENLDSLCIYMADLFGDKATVHYKRELQHAYSNEERYYLLKRKISFQQWEAMKKFPLIKLGKNKSGFIANVRMKRLNPYKLFANRTIGITRDSNKVGLESAYDTSLSGENGVRLVRYVSGGGSIPIEGSEVESVDGSDIVTTLDVAIQDVAEQALAKMMKENSCEHGTCIVMEVKTGKIKAIANLGRQKDSTYWEDYNYAVSTTEPGSTFKLATLISVLEDGFVNINSPVNLEGGKWNVAGETVYDAEVHGLYQTTIQHAFEHSSNVGMAKLVYGNYYNQPSKFLAHLHRLHLDTLTGIDLPGEAWPSIHKPGTKYWSRTTLPWMGFGYSLAVTPLQILMLYNAVANGGKMMRPYLVNAIAKDGEVIQQHIPVTINERICSPDVLRQLYICLEGVVLNGTARRLKTNTYRIAGKTGTALIADKDVTYADKVYQSSFAGFFPVEDPQYSCIVVIRNRPHANKFFGADVAGPVFREVADKLFGMKVKAGMKQLSAIGAHNSSFKLIASTGIAKKIMNAMGVKWADSTSELGTSVVTTDRYCNVVMKGSHSTKESMPMICGMALKDAVAMCENAGLRVTVEGSGRIVYQSIQSGMKIESGQTIHIKLDATTYNNVNNDKATIKKHTDSISSVNKNVLSKGKHITTNG